MMTRLAILLLAFACVGCANTRPYTDYEKQLLVGGIVADTVDLGLTSIALNSGDFDEGNSVYWDTDDIGAMMLVKILKTIAAYFAGHIWPEYRKAILWGNVGAGALPAVWNAYQMGSN